MKILEYKIAWIDDQPSSAEGFHQRISNLLARHGFQLKVDWISRENELNSFLKSLNSNSQYDLILVDWKLGAMVKKGESGSTVARAIRLKNPPSYVVFYSSENRVTLMGLISNESIDGVYCVNREQFVIETSDVIRSSIRRFEDIETMRGIFLSAVASFDTIVKQSLIAGFNEVQESEKIKITESLIKRLEKYHSSQLEKINDIDKSSGISSILEKLNIGSSQELNCLIDLLSIATPSVNYQKALETLISYKNEFLPGRNDLAHVEESSRDDVSIVERNGRVWDPSQLGQYRQRIVDHHDNLVYVRDALIKELTEHLNKTRDLSREINYLGK